MFGSKVFLTYKRKRQSSCEDAHNFSLSTQDKLDKQTAEEASEKHEEKPMVRFLKLQLLVSLIFLWSMSLFSTPTYLATFVKPLVTLGINY